MPFYFFSLFHNDISVYYILNYFVCCFSSIEIKLKWSLLTSAQSQVERTYNFTTKRWKLHQLSIPSQIQRKKGKISFLAANNFARDRPENSTVKKLRNGLLLKILYFVIKNVQMMNKTATANQFIRSFDTYFLKLKWMRLAAYGKCHSNVRFTIRDEKAHSNGIYD